MADDPIKINVDAFETEENEQVKVLVQTLNAHATEDDRLKAELDDPQLDETERARKQKRRVLLAAKIKSLREKIKVLKG